MVAPKRGRATKAQAAKSKAAVEPAAEQSNEESESMEVGDSSIEENNGDNSQQKEQESGTESASTEAGGVGAQSQSSSTEVKPEEKKEEKIVPGKVLVENLPSSYLFDYQEKLKVLFSKHGEVTSVKRGPIIVTELTTTPTLSAIVEFKNKDSLEKALAEDGAVLDGSRIAVAVESRPELAILVGVPFEAGIEYVRLLFGECGEISHIQEFGKTKYKILRVTFQTKDSVDKALKLDRELRINGFLMTVTKYRDDEEQAAHNANVNKNKRQHPQQQNRNANTPANSATNRNNNYRGRGSFNTRGTFRGSRGRGFGTRGGGGAFPRGGYAGGMNNYMPPGGFMRGPGYLL